MKKRLDILLTEKGLCDTRSRAKALIMEGVVLVDGIVEDKAGSLFSETAKIELKENPIPYVSRGGLKIEKAIKEFDIDLHDCVVMDVGASTGGFTDCMLKNKAKKVYSIDVGYGQLDYRLRMDPRVVVMERTNIRKVTPEDLDEVPVFSTVDVSFISLKTVLPVIKSLLAPDHGICALIKPQFEAGKEQVGKNGVVRDPEIHKNVVSEIVSFVRDLGYGVHGLSYSPIKGPKGNIEYLIYMLTSEDSGVYTEDKIKEIIEQSHENLRE